MMTAQGPEMTVMETGHELWGYSYRPTACSQCEQSFLMPEKRGALLCPSCVQAVLQDQPVRLPSEPPEKVVPFQVKRTALEAILEDFVHGVWLKLDDFNVETLLQRAAPVFVPLWLVDSDVSGSWQSEMGFGYQVKSSQEYYSSRGWQTRESLEQRVRWQPRAGTMQRHYDNAIAPAMSDHEDVMIALGTYEMKRALAYDPKWVRGALLRAPDLQTDQAWPIAKESMERRAMEDCMQAAGAEHMRGFAGKLAYSDQRWTQLLIPYYCSHYSDDDGRCHPVFINGQTGAIRGLRLASQRKGWKWAGILAAAALLLFVLALVCFALGALFPPAAFIGAGLALLALLLGAGALVPALWPWQWNRRQKGIGVRELG